MVGCKQNCALLHKISRRAWIWRTVANTCNEIKSFALIHLPPFAKQQGFWSCVVPYLLGDLQTMFHFLFIKHFFWREKWIDATGTSGIDYLPLKGSCINARLNGIWQNATIDNYKTDTPQDLQLARTHTLRTVCTYTPCTIRWRRKS